MNHWAMKLTKYGLQYKPRTATKAQTLIDFVVECTISKEEFDEAYAGRAVKKSKTDMEKTPYNKVKFFVDGSSTDTV